MGIFTRSAWEGSCIGITFVGAVFNGFVLYWLQQIARESAARRNSRVEDEDEKRCLFWRCGDWRRTMYLTKASVVCFFLSAFVGLFHRVLYFALCPDCNLRSALFALYTTSGTLGYALMFLAHFERLRLTFRGSVMELQQWAPKLMYGAFLLFVVLFMSTSALRFSQPKAASVTITLAIVVYALGVCTLIRAFYKKTLAAARNSPSQSSDLLAVAVRITVVATVSVLSTTFAFLLFVVLFRICHMCYFWLTVGMLLVICDQSLNSFCLMCTFGGAVPAYKRVFGPLHNVLLWHVSKTPAKIVSRMRAASNTAADYPTADEV